MTCCQMTSQCIQSYSGKLCKSDGSPGSTQSWYHREPHASSLCFQNSIFLPTPLPTPFTRRLTPTATRTSTILFLSDRFSQYSLVTIARNSQRDRQRSQFATRSQGQRIIQRFVSVGRGHRATKSTCTHEADPRRLAFILAVRFQLELPRATISSSYSELTICLRCEGMSWSHGSSSARGF